MRGMATTMLMTLAAGCALRGRWRGIEEATGLVDYTKRMRGSEEHPRSKLHKIMFHLDFMGHGGSKWSLEMSEMEAMLVRVGERKGTVRMLLLKPDCAVCEKASKERFEGDAKALPKKNIESLLRLHELRSKFDHLQIKLYEHAPFFRLTFIDKTAVVVGHYQQYWQDSANSPLLVWEDGAEGSQWSFYIPWGRYFEEEWKEGTPMSADKLKKLAEEYGVT